jgi:hypothetical protein
LPAGGTSLMTVTLSGGTIHSPGSVMWDGLHRPHRSKGPSVQDGHLPGGLSRDGAHRRGRGNDPERYVCHSPSQ